MCRKHHMSVRVDRQCHDDSLLKKGESGSGQWLAEHLLPSREHQQAHGAALQASCTPCCCLLSPFLLHLLLFLHSLRRPRLLWEELPLDSSLWFFPSFFYSDTWGSSSSRGRGLYSRAEPSQARCLVSGLQLTFGWRWCRFGLFWQVLLGAVWRFWTGWNLWRRWRGFREGSGLLAELTPRLIQHGRCGFLEQKPERKADGEGATLDLVTPLCWEAGWWRTAAGGSGSSGTRRCCRSCRADATVMAHRPSTSDRGCWSHQDTAGTTNLQYSNTQNSIHNNNNNRRNFFLGS